MIATRAKVEVALNVGFAAIALLATIWLTRLSVASFVPVLLGLFLLIRRYSAVISTVANLGLSNGQIRYAAIAQDSPVASAAIHFSVFSTYVLISGGLLALTYIGQDHIAPTLFPDDPAASFWLWVTSALAVQFMFHHFIQASLLVKRRIVSYNLFKIASSSGIFIVVLSGQGESTLEDVFLLYLYINTVLILGGCAFVLAGPMIIRRQVTLSLISRSVSDLVAYGPPRCLVNSLDALLFVTGPWLLRHNMAEAGNLIIVYLVIQSVSLVILPVNELAMVFGARAAGQNDERRLQQMVVIMFEAAFVVSFLATATVIYYHTLFFGLLVGNDANLMHHLTAYLSLLFAIIPLSIFNALKGIIEVRWTRPYNLAALGMAHAAGISVFYLLRTAGYAETEAVSLAMLLMFVLIGVVSVWCLRQYMARVSWKDMAAFILCSIAVLVARSIAFGQPVDDHAIVGLLDAAATASFIVVLWVFLFKPKLIRVLRA